MRKSIGDTFADELTQAGVPLDGVVWRSDGSIDFSKAVSPTVQAQVQSVLAAHNPTATKPKSPREQAKEKLLARNPAAITDPVLKDVVEFLQESER